MDTTNELSLQRLEAERAILRQSLDEMAIELGTALREAPGLDYPVYFAVPYSGDALATIITSVDPPHDDWKKVVAIFSKIIEARLGCVGLCTGELPCKAVNSAASGADVITGRVDVYRASEGFTRSFGRRRFGRSRNGASSSSMRAGHIRSICSKSLAVLASVDW